MNGKRKITNVNLQLGIFSRSIVDKSTSVLDRKSCGKLISPTNITFIIIPKALLMGAKPEPIKFEPKWSQVTTAGPTVEMVQSSEWTLWLTDHRCRAWGCLVGDTGLQYLHPSCTQTESLLLSIPISLVSHRSPGECGALPALALLETRIWSSLRSSDCSSALLNGVYGKHERSAPKRLQKPF
ncbi:hypothetical protein K438DRAFT_1779285 [Mycena galopus ATCC 62051]|nr:hypothetical protein K438DRAFT_1779285 [Mycena galopus ATCC 62051]